MGRLVDIDNLVTQAELAAQLGVRTSAVSNWRKRHPDFPLPLIHVAGTAVYDRAEVRDWARLTGRLERRDQRSLAQQRLVSE